MTGDGAGAGGGPGWHIARPSQLPWRIPIDQVLPHERTPVPPARPHLCREAHKKGLHRTNVRNKLGLGGFRGRDEDDGGGSPIATKRGPPRVWHPSDTRRRAE